MANTRQKDCSLAAFSLIELLVVVAIIAILASLLLPGLARAKLKGKQTACVSNLKQLGVAFNLYCADNDGKLPENLPGNSKDTPSWVMGDMRDPMQATNEALLNDATGTEQASAVEAKWERHHDRLLRDAQRLRALIQRPGRGLLGEWAAAVRRLREELDRELDLPGDRARNVGAVLDTCAHLMCNRLGVPLTAEPPLRRMAALTMAALLDNEVNRELA